MNEARVVSFIAADLDDSGLDPYTFRVYCRVLRRAGNGEAFESCTSMGEACKMSEKAVRTCLKKLLDAKLIVAEKRLGQTTVYRLKDTPTPELRSDPPVPRSEVKVPTPEPPTEGSGKTFRPTPVPRSDKGYPIEGNPIKEKKTSSSPIDTMIAFLPDTHRGDEMRKALVDYFSMRSKKKYGLLLPENLEKQALEFGEYPASAVIAALNTSTVRQYRGVFVKGKKEALVGEGNILEGWVTLGK